MNIGFIDSGIGGISTLKKCLKEFPNMNYIYIADTLYAPYGRLNKDFLTKRIKELISLLENRGVDKIVLACNSSSVTTYYDKVENTVPIIRVLPEIKRALYENTGKTLLISTEITANSMYVKRFHTERLSVLGEKYLASLIEDVAPNFFEMEEYMRKILAPYMNYDAILLGCTHYLFVADIIKKTLPNVNIYDSNERVIKELKYKCNESSKDIREFIITGDEKDKYLEIIKKLF